MSGLTYDNHVDNPNKSVGVVFSLILRFDSLPIASIDAGREKGQIEFTVGLGGGYLASIFESTGAGPLGPELDLRSDRVFA